MTASEKDPNTQLPRSMSLGDVLNSIRMAPQDISRLLSDWSNQYVGGTHHTLGIALRTHAQMVTDPQTYGWKPAQNADAPDAPDPIEQRASYGQDAPGRAPAVATFDRPDDAQDDPWTTPAAPQAQGQATTSGTLATPAATPSEQSRASVAPQPTTPPTPPDADASGKAAESARPLGMDDASGSNVPSHVSP